MPHVPAVPCANLIAVPCAAFACGALPRIARGKVRYSRRGGGCSWPGVMVLRVRPAAHRRCGGLPLVCCCCRGWAAAAAPRRSSWGTLTGGEGAAGSRRASGSRRGPPAMLIQVGRRAHVKEGARHKE